MEPQLPDLASQVAGVGLAEIFGVPGEQANQEVDPAEVTVTQLGSQDRTSGSISISYSPAMHLMLYAFAAMGQQLSRVPAAM